MQQQSLRLVGLLVLLVWAADYADSQLTLTGATQGFPDFQLCSSQLADAWLQQSSPQNITKATIVDQLLKTKLYPCLLNTTQGTIITTIKMLIGGNANITMQAMGKRYTNATGVKIQYTSTAATVNDLNLELITEAKQNGTGLSHNAYLFDSLLTPQLFERGALVDLAPYIAADPTLVWDDIKPIFRGLLAAYEGQLVAIPLDARITLLYTRTDILAKQNLTVPRTLDELLVVAKKLNGTDWNNDTKPDYGMCLRTSVKCGKDYFLFSLAASLLQTHGPKQGYMFDVDDFKPLVKSAAMKKALDVWLELASYSPNDDNLKNCPSVPPAWNEGRCAMLIGYASQFKPGWNDSTSDYLEINYVPGSAEVLDRASDTLVPCTPDRCPFATPILQDGKSVLVNYVPLFVSGGWAAALGGLAPQKARDETFKYLSYVANPSGSFSIVSDPTSTFAPFRTSHFNPAPWIARGYRPIVATRSLAAINEALDHKNIGLPLRVSIASDFRDAINAILEDFKFYRIDATEVMNRWQVQTDNIINAYGRDALIKQYRNALGIVEDKSTNTTIVYDRSAKDDVPWGLAVGLPVAVGGAMIILAICAYLYFKSAKDSRVDYFGRVTAPKATVDSTLLVTDIENSTTLWETLSPEVMDVALQMHHSNVRDQLASNFGYEVATEGDSFIVAFHNPADAVRFAVAVQDAMLNSQWSTDVLKQTALVPQYFVASTLDGEGQVHRSQLSVTSVPAAAAPAAPTLLGKIPFLSRFAAGQKEVLVIEPTDVEIAIPAPDHTAHQQNEPQPKSERASSGAIHDFAQSIGSNWSKRRSGSNTSGDIIDSQISLEAKAKSGLEDGKKWRRRSGMGPTIGEKDAMADITEGTELCGGHGIVVAASDSRTVTYRESMKAMWTTAEEQTQRSVLVFRGLRIRIGIHSGILEADVVSGGGRTTYTGASLSTAKTIGDTAHGCMVVLSESSYLRLPMERMWKEVMVVHCGVHTVKDEMPATALYQVVAPSLQYRLAALEPLRTKTVISAGAMEAPVNTVTIVFWQFVGVKTLLGWDPVVTRTAINMAQTTALEQLQANRGYAVEVDDCLILASFCDPADAVLWCLNTQQLLMHLDWPDEILEHELCEALTTETTVVDNRHSFVEIPKLLMRGLRSKAGIDRGGAKAGVHAVSGRMAYRGRVMNRAARVAAKATAGQVLCTNDVWNASEDVAVQLISKGVGSVSQGSHQLKGVPEPMELFNCRYAK